MKRHLFRLGALGILVLLAGFWLTRPERVDPADFASLQGDAAAGQLVFLAAGCGSCHTAPESEDVLVLAGGQKFPSPFGTFLAPNISNLAQDGWTLADLASAVRYGTSPNGQHYYPAFPYTTYSRMQDQQIADLWAYLQTLPADSTPNQPHEVGFPFNIRLGLGAWKLLYLRDDFVLTGDLSPELARGRELVEVLGHCGECHTPRGRIGGMQKDQWLAGAATPDGKARFPALTPDKLTWSAGDIAYYLETGFTPDFDSAGGHMVSVIRNFAQLSAEDRAAVAAYLKALPGS